MTIMDFINDRSEIVKFYRKKNIFITGATGFVGMALIEKLLRFCDVKTIYILMRAKKDKSIESRTEELIKNPVFEKLREELGDAPLKNIIPVPGDVGEKNLGLTEQDRQTLIDNVHVIFHSAATLDFEASLKQTVNINLLGTRRIVELASEISNIEALVHVSSAYVNSNRKVAVEVIYRAPGDVEKIINLATELSEEDLAAMTPKLLHDHPNTYTLTKAFAEHEILKLQGKISSAIVRPSMIVAAWRDPIPGWTISKNGPQGFIMGAGKGVIRRLPIGKNLVYDYIPVDIVINELIAAGWFAAKTNSDQTLVFHCTTSTANPFTWTVVENLINEKLQAFPLKSAVWYPTMKLLPSLRLYRIAAVFVHFIPAFFLDLFLRLTGSRPKLVKLHRNVNRSLGRLAPFIFQEWMFDNTKTMQLYEEMNIVDQVAFNLDVNKLDWVEFFTELVRGVRRYLHNEDPKSLPAARKKNKILFIMNILVQVLVFSSIWYLYSVISNNSMLSVFWVVPLTYALFNII